MKIYNLEKTQILNESEINPNFGYLKDDSKIIGKTESAFVTEESENGNKTTFIPEKVQYEKIKVYIPYTQKEMKENQISELEEWFERDYRYLYEKYTRKIAMGLLNKDGSNPTIKLNELYSVAESKAQILHSLREEL